MTANDQAATNPEKPAKASFATLRIDALPRGGVWPCGRPQAPCPHSSNTRVVADASDGHRLFKEGYSKKLEDARVPLRSL